MITPLTLIAIEQQGRWIQCKAAAPASFQWRAGTQIDIAIPDPALVPHAVRSTWLSSSTNEGLVEWLFQVDDSPFILALQSLKQGDFLYIKLTSNHVAYPQQGVWVAVHEAAAVMRGFAIEYQTTNQPIGMILYQTQKAYFVELTRVAGQHPMFHIHVATTFDELVGFILLYPSESFTVIAPQQDIAMLQHVFRDCNIPQAQVVFHGI